MNGVKIKDIRGALIEKNKYDGNSVYTQTHKSGFNEAIEQQGEVAITINNQKTEGELVGMRYEDKDPFFEYKEGRMSKRKLISVISDRIISKQHELFERVSNS